jgi:hypothetical protein
MDPFFTVLALVLFALPAVVLAAPAIRRPVGFALGVAAAILMALAVGGAGETRELTVTHAFAAYVGSVIESKRFVIETVTAPGWRWAALGAAWALAWATWAIRRGRRPLAVVRWPLVGPVAAAWGGAALILGFQKTAAPAPLALGLDIATLPHFEIALWPAMVAAAFVLAAGRPTIPQFVFLLTIAVALAHLPLAIVGTLFTYNELGTSLDVHSIDHIANPLTRLSTPLEPKSHEQLAWLIWTPQLLMWPALTMLSAGGAGFAAVMAQREPR